MSSVFFAKSCDGLSKMATPTSSSEMVAAFFSFSSFSFAAAIARSTSSLITISSGEVNARTQIFVLLSRDILKISLE